MPHLIEAAKSGRATCRTCQQKIAKDELRFGEEVANAFDAEGGTSTQWHHLACAAKKKPQLVKEALSTYGGEVPNRAEIDRIIEENWNTARPPFPYAEHAPTGRSRCQHCREPIEKGALRVAMARPAGSLPPDGAAYLHTTCAPAHLSDPDLLAKLKAHSRGLGDDEIAELERTLSSPKA